MVHSLKYCNYQLSHFAEEEGKRKTAMKEFDEFDAKKRHSNGSEPKEIAVSGIKYQTSTGYVQSGASGEGPGWVDLDLGCSTILVGQ